MTASGEAAALVLIITCNLLDDTPLNVYYDHGPVY